MDALLSVDVLDGPAPVAVFGLAAALLVVLLLRAPSRRRLIALGIAVAAGGLVAVALWLVCVRWLNLFGGSLGQATYLWVAATCAAVAVAVLGLWRTPRWRVVVAAVSIPVFVAAGALAVNAVFGLNRTLGSMFSVVVQRPIDLRPPTGSDGYDARLWKDWRAPAGMPERGKTGTAVIPATESGFRARPAGVYLPPAALTKHPPRLPLVVMMMGQPGNPDPQWIAGALDEYAARHHGLAPIVVVADQLGPGGDDTLCLDTARYGKVETYVTRDVAAWAQTHLNVTADHRFWTVAGYSNGGLCALSFGVKHAQTFRNILDISGEEFPGAEHPEQTLRTAFGGRQRDYDAAKPLSILASKSLPGTTAVFTASVDDPGYLEVARRSAAVARGSGMNVQLCELPRGGHTVATLALGLRAGFRVLYPILGLQAPG